MGMIVANCVMTLLCLALLAANWVFWSAYYGMYGL